MGNEREIEQLREQIKALEKQLRDTQHNVGVSERSRAGLLEAIKSLRIQLGSYLSAPHSTAVIEGEGKKMLIYKEDEKTGKVEEFLVDTFRIIVHGRIMTVAVDAELMKKEGARLIQGRIVDLNELMVIIRAADDEEQERLMLIGDEATIDEIVGERYIRVAIRHDEKRLVVIPRIIPDDVVRTMKVNQKWTIPSISSGFFIGGKEPLPKYEIGELELEEVPDITFDDIGGLEKQIEEIRDGVELPYLYPEYFQEMRLPPPKGILLSGPPGCGKTMIAKAIANRLAKMASEKRGEKIKGYFLNIKGPELLNKYVGETERKIRELFQKAKDKASGEVPVIIFFDEMDALFRQRGSGISSDMEVTIVPQLLSEIDGIEGLRNVIVIGASNRQDLIDPAVLRPGRLDLKIKIDRPNAPQSFDILSKHFKLPLPIHPKYLKAHPEPYVMPNRLRDLFPSQWKIVDYQLTPIYERFGMKRHDAGMIEVPFEAEAKEAAEKVIAEVAMYDPDLAKKMRHCLEPQKWTHEEWFLENEQDVLNLFKYKAIESIYLETDLAYFWWAKNGEPIVHDTRFMRVTYANGESEILYHKDFNSGALLESISRRARKHALKRWISHQDKGLQMVDVWVAIREEFKGSEDLPNTTNPDDWARISGKKGQRIVNIERISEENPKDTFRKFLYSERLKASPPQQETKIVNTGQYL